MFFTSIIYKQKQVSESKLAINVLTDLQTLTTGAELSSNTYSNITSKGNILKFSCVDCDCNYNLQNILSPSPVSYNGRALFAPSLVKGDHIITFSLDWNMPFKVTNFLFLTSDKIRYVFPNRGSNSNFFKMIQDALHKGMYVSDLMGATYTNQNEQKVRFVFFDETSPIEVSVGNAQALNTKNLNYQDITAVNIIPSSNPLVGKVEFYRKNPRSQQFELLNTFPYLDLPSLIAAIVVDDPDLYRCPMADAVKRLHYASQSYQGRLGELKTYYSDLGHQDIKCSSRYEFAENPLGQIITNSEVKFESLTEDNLEKIYSSAFSESTGLAFHNNRLQIFSCPEVY